MDRNLDSCQPRHRPLWQTGCIPHHGNSGAPARVAGQAGNPSDTILLLPMRLRASHAHNNIPCSFPIYVRPQHTSKSQHLNKCGDTPLIEKTFQIHRESKTSAMDYPVTGIMNYCDNSRFLDNISPHIEQGHNCRNHFSGYTPHPAKDRERTIDYLPGFHGPRHR